MARKPNSRGKTISKAVKKPFLAPAHKAILDHWFNNGCVSKKRAMLAAGYSDSVATYNARTIFDRPDVLAEIERRRNLMTKRRDVTEQRIIDEYAKIAFSNLGDLIEVNEDGTANLDFNYLTEDHKAALAEFSVETGPVKLGEIDAEGNMTDVVHTFSKAKIKFASKQAALDSLARIKGMFRDRVEISTDLSLVEKVQAARARIAAGKPKE